MKNFVIFFSFICFFINNICVYAIDTSYSSIVIDSDSGRILYEKNKDEKMLIASTTKIMTAVIAIENNNLDEIVEVGEEILPMYGSNIYLEVGEKISLRNLLYGLILRSGNDAAVVIAKHISGSESKFVELMNIKAKKLGMNNTLFNNSHGLDDDTQNYSTAYDMSKLMKYANTLIDFVEISGTKKWSFSTNKKSYIWYNRNKLLNEYKYATGGKTGYTPKAGKTIVSTATKSNLNLIAVSIKDNNHYDTQKELYDTVFSKYKNVLIVDKNNFKLSNSQYNDLYINYNFSYPLADKEYELIDVKANLYKISSYHSNQKVGELIVTFKNEEVYRESIYIREENNKKKAPNLLKKIINFFSSLF